ncbi:MAG: class I SAM-dependent DNA methyltransferase [Alphaproteobacteria bacterium]
MNDHSSLVSKVWNYAHVLRDEGIAYGDYLEQITYLLFLKMDDEREHLLGEGSSIPDEWKWAQLRDKRGDELELQYRHALENLGRSTGMIGTIFRKAQNKIQDPAKLSRLVAMIDEETWLGLKIDVKGAIYEGLLQRNAEETKSGAGQYFTPRPLIDAIVEVMQPTPTTTVHDPACGTGGFLLSAFEHMKNQTQDRALLRKLQTDMISGSEIVESVVSLCAMNLYLHGVGDAECPIVHGDALAGDPGARFGMVLANPPFGKRSSVTYIGDDGGVHRESETYERTDFRVSTSNKQLNFLQHIMTILDVPGTAAVVLPDNVLFEGGTGERIRRRLLDQFDLHTVLRLPTGIFYKQGVKANVLFFDKKPASDTPWTKEVWFYDFRTNQHFTLKANPLQRVHLDQFVTCYRPGERQKREESERFRKFTYDELVARDKLNLDIFWLRDDSIENTDDLPPPDVIAVEIIDNLEAALEEFRGVAAELGADVNEAAE